MEKELRIRVLLDKLAEVGTYGVAGGNSEQVGRWVESNSEQEDIQAG